MRRATVRLIAASLAFAAAAAAPPPPAAAADLYPKQLDVRTQQAIKRGLDYLARTQGPDGDWRNAADGQAYPAVTTALAGMAMLAHGNTPTRGQYADNIRRAELYVLACARPSGLITDDAGAIGRPMYGHGFGLLFLASAYGMETDPRVRDRSKKVITDAIKLTGAAQSGFGGWTYTPGGGDEGSVTVTQMQALRACSNAGFHVPKGVVEAAVKYLEACKTPEGGITYSLGSGPPPRPAISAAAVCCLYNAGEYDSRLAEECLKYVWDHFKQHDGQFDKGTGHEFYSHLYASQAFYQAGDKYWDKYFPQTRDQLLKMQDADGAWTGDGIGPVYGTSIALIILQMPYKLLPIYQR
jgi:hypothetical protein